MLKKTQTMRTIRMTMNFQQIRLPSNSKTERTWISMMTTRMSRTVKKLTSYSLMRVRRTQTSGHSSKMTPIVHARRLSTAPQKRKPSTLVTSPRFRTMASSSTRRRSSGELPSLIPFAELFPRRGKERSRASRSLDSVRTTRMTKMTSSLYHQVAR